ncbi:MAG: hypothetical protein ABIW38_02905 [Ferruginibacter sp.]
MPNDQSILQELQELQSNKTLLQVQLKDLNELIAEREEELDLLRQKAAEAARLKSVLDNAIGEIEFLQESIDEEKKDNYESLQLAELEKELLATLKENQQYEEQLSQKQSLQANLQQAEDELGMAMDYYTKCRQLQEKLSITQSNLELAELEMEDMKILIAQLKQQNQLLVQKIEDN